MKRTNGVSGANPWHGSKTGSNLFIFDESNLVYCFRCETTINVAQVIALENGIINSCTDKMSHKDFLKVLKLAQDKYHLPKTVNENNDVYEQFQQCISDEAYNKAAEVIAAYIEDCEYIITIRHDITPEIYIYRNGIYVKQGSTYIQQTIREISAEQYTSSLKNKVLQRIMADTYREQSIIEIGHEQKEFVAIENGILNLKTKNSNHFHL